MFVVLGIIEQFVMNRVDKVNNIHLQLIRNVIRWYYSLFVGMAGLMVPSGLK